MKKIIVFLLLLLAARGYCDTFGGVRASGMGQAFGAVTGDADAVYYNPAGLRPIDAMQLKLGFGSLYAGGSLGFLGGAVFAFPSGIANDVPAAIHVNNSSIQGTAVQETGISAAWKGPV